MDCVSIALKEIHLEKSMFIYVRTTISNRGLKKRKKNKKH